MYSLLVFCCGMCAAAFTAVQQPTTLEKAAHTGSAPAALLGRITGALSYPSDYLPADMKVTAVPVSGGRTYATTKKRGTRYTLVLPAGKYYVYATTRDLPAYKAYYTDMVTCGLSIDCHSHRKIVVTVKAGRTTPNVDPQDWYDN
jgi:hypothetical protein